MLENSSTEKVTTRCLHFITNLVIYKTKAVDDATEDILLGIYCTQSDVYYIGIIIPRKKEPTELI